MVGEKKEKAPEQQFRLMHICPACGKTVDMSRSYCDCHASLREASVTASANSPEVKPCNFESPGLNCSDCPETCMPCASYGLPEANRAGFGGKNCWHKKTGTALCYCCEAQTKLAIDLRDNVSFSQLAREVLERRRAEGKPENLAGKNVFLEAADINRELMEQPVLDRINQKLEQAG
jgi:hypothetical protein